jgi:hypothetical protein
MANGSGDAISSKDVAMYLTKADVPPYTGTPTAVSKSKPTVITMPDVPTPPDVEVPVLQVSVGPVTTILTDPSSFALIKSQGAGNASVTFSGFTDTWTPLNGTYVATPLPDGSASFEVPVDSSTFTPNPDLTNVMGSLKLAPLGTLTPGMLVRPMDTGFAEIDNKVFPIGAVNGDQITLLGSDTSKSMGTLNVVDGKLQIWNGAGLVRLCLTGFTFNPETPGTNNVGTYCNPSATLPSVATSAGTATLSGWIDKDNLGYQELVDAADDAVERIFSIVLPQDQGEIVAPITFSSMTWDIPLDGGMAFTATGALGANPRHLFSVT